MLGLGNIFSSVFGKFFDSIGMGWMNNVLSLAVNVAMGNWIGAAQDVFNLVAQFSNNDWMQRVASFQPLGDFDIGGCFGGGRNWFESALGGLLSNNRAGEDLLSLPRSVSQTFSLASFTLENSSRANQNLQNAHNYAHV